ncbi:MAG: response regulator [Syntrophorhabdales bacterium]|jgi:DNA-binding response OmpR family regulator
MGRRVLFVDGDRTIVEAINAMLVGMGHHVRMETSGVDALRVFSKNPGGFDLIIADLGMPDMSGLLLVEKLLLVRSDIPVVLLTGLEGQAQSKARESGIHWFGMKPLSMTDLAATVENALAEAA